MRFGSVCSGIEAASVAWHPLGWKAAWLAEIEPFPSAVLAHHYPTVPNLGDMTTITRRVLSGEVEAPDVFTGGTPCQAFSVAGLRRSLDDARGNLSLTFCEIADAIDHVRIARGDQPAVIVWENVPGVLSTKDNAFGCFIAALAGGTEPVVPPDRWTDAGLVLGPKRAVAWRVLDAQYFGLAQRRRRVWVVASARDDFDPAAVLFEWDRVRRDSAPSREPGKDTAARAAAGTGVRRWPADVASTLNAAFGEKQGLEDQHALGGAQLFVPAPIYATDGQLIPVAFHPTQDPISSTDGTTHAMGTGSKGGCATVAVAVAVTGEVFHTLRAEGFDASEDGTGRGAGAVAVAYDMQSDALNGAVFPTIQAEGQRTGNRGAGVMVDMAVRRLTPRECERLQGFPDDYTLIPWKRKPASECPDGPRYKALGNSWAVPCAAWIGRRIAEALA